MQETQNDLMGFPGSSAVKNPPSMKERQIQSLVQKGPLEKEMETHSILLAWKTHRQRTLVAIVPGVARVRHDLVTKHDHHHQNDRGYLGS